MPTQKTVTISKKTESGEVLTAEVAASSAALYKRKGWDVTDVPAPAGDAPSVETPVIEVLEQEPKPRSTGQESENKSK